VLEKSFTYQAVAQVTNMAGSTFCPVLLKTGGTSTNLKANEDDVYVDVDLPFDFKYFGHTYSLGTKVHVTTNGWITFEAMSFLAGRVPQLVGAAELELSNSVIAPFFMDMNSARPGRSTRPYRDHAEPAVRHRLARLRPARGDGKLLDERYAFEVILYESSNDVKFQYLNSFGGAYTDGTGAVAGMQGLRELDSTLWGYSLWNKAGPRAADRPLAGGRTVTFHYDEADASTYYGASASTELAALAVASVNPAATGYQGTSAASFQLGFTLR